MFKLRITISVCFIFLALSSCVKHTELITLKDTRTVPAGSQPGMPSEGQAPYYGSHPLATYHLRIYDNLLVNLNNSEEGTIGAFNADGAIGSFGANVSPGMLYLKSYTIDQDGFIELPVIGRLQVVGLTIAEVKKLIDNNLKKDLTTPYTQIKLGNFRVTVLGEVTRPGVNYVYDDRTTVFQAIAMAGDMTDYADRKRIKLVREIEGSNETVYLDLTDEKVFSSPYMYIMPGDVIYVEPLKAKAAKVNAQVVSIIISAVSVVSLIGNVIVNASR